MKKKNETFIRKKIYNWICRLFTSRNWPAAEMQEHAKVRVFAYSFNNAALLQQGSKQQPTTSNGRNECSGTECALLFPSTGKLIENHNKIHPERGISKKYFGREFKFQPKRYRMRSKYGQFMLYAFSNGFMLCHLFWNLSTNLLCHFFFSFRVCYFVGNLELNNKFTFLNVDVVRGIESPNRIRIELPNW